MCFGGGGGQPEQPMNKPSYAPSNAETAVVKTVGPDKNTPAATQDAPAASTPKVPTGTGLDTGSM